MTNAPPVATVHVVLVARVWPHVLLKQLTQLGLLGLRKVLLKLKEHLRTTDYRQKSHAEISDAVQKSAEGTHVADQRGEDVLRVAEDRAGIEPPLVHRRLRVSREERRRPKHFGLLDLKHGGSELRAAGNRQQQETGSSSRWNG